MSGDTSSNQDLWKILTGFSSLRDPVSVNVRCAHVRLVALEAGERGVVCKGDCRKAQTRPELL